MAGEDDVIDSTLRIAKAGDSFKLVLVTLGLMS
jgi:hypothetical protein